MWQAAASPSSRRDDDVTGLQYVAIKLVVLAMEGISKLARGEWGGDLILAWGRYVLL